MILNRLITLSGQYLNLILRNFHSSFLSLSKSTPMPKSLWTSFFHVPKNDFDLVIELNPNFVPHLLENPFLPKKIRTTDFSHSPFHLTLPKYKNIELTVDPKLLLAGVDPVRDFLKDLKVTILFFPFLLVMAI